MCMYVCIYIHQNIYHTIDILKSRYVYNASFCRILFIPFWISGFLDFWISAPGFLDFWISGFLDFCSGISGFLDFWISGFRVSPHFTSTGYPITRNIDVQCQFVAPQNFSFLYYLLFTSFLLCGRCTWGILILLLFINY